MLDLHTIPSMQALSLTGQRVVIREDLNVPMENGKISDDTRIQRALPSLRDALEHGASVLVLSHLGRPKKPEFDAHYSLAAVAKALTRELQQAVPLLSNWLDGVDIKPGQIALAENVRFQAGEMENDAQLAKRMAALADIFVMDAFATAHRAQASTTGIAHYAPVACAGPLLLEELTALGKALTQPQRPLVAIVGGSKVSSKIQLLESLLTKVDTLIVGGGMANTFLAAQGYAVGESLVENDWLDTANTILTKAQTAHVAVPLPVDVAVAKQFSAQAAATIKKLAQIEQDDRILDIGPTTAKQYQHILQQAKTIVWNGPVGVFEFANFSAGTKAIAQAVADSAAYSIAGGGDTLAALAQFNVMNDISYVSTGGGAFLTFLQNTPLPAVEALIKK